MSSKKEDVLLDDSQKEDTKKDKPSIVEKIVDSIHKDIIDVLETIRETENS